MPLAVAADFPRPTADLFKTAGNADIVPYNEVMDGKRLFLCIPLLGAFAMLAGRSLAAPVGQNPGA